MLHLTFKDKSKNYYECNRQFHPKGSEIELGVEGDENGPKQNQKDFFLSIEKKYDEIVISIGPKIEVEFKNWKEDFRIKDFKKEFRPVYMFLPRCDKQPITWEIAFESDHDLNHLFTVKMKDMSAIKVSIDG
ncbi:hypothetical protein FHS59_004691 [Algoriphagus iocasae]|uniref:Uncharacterized protein n=1 Tax=Algoriphagus iocasae TaxID=1836499 RepID=A0A841MTZ5_9BACT|nr:hypothetical protein [Algoriphagus iocasae]MBB6329027.1 hypothetical protein [Algoriphagus iocasae]